VRTHDLSADGDSGDVRARFSRKPTQFVWDRPLPVNPTRSLPERFDRLTGEERMPPVVVAFSDCFTRLGDNQYINSVSIGVWKDFLLHDMRF
jgi:hypothetical protein